MLVVPSAFARDLLARCDANRVIAPWDEIAPLELGVATEG